VIRVAAIGDVVGKAGRQSLEHFLPRLRDEFSPDIVLANGENAAGGFGLTRKVFDLLTGSMGIDCITMGNHWHDKREIYDFCEKEDRLVLPANMSNCDDTKHGLKILKSRSGVSFAVVNLIGKAFMHADNRPPFPAADKIFARIPDFVKVRLVDMHAEATSEKQGMGRYLCGRASLVYGTHSHVPTADERILDGKTGYITDLGMTGPYESVIGIKVQPALERLISGVKKNFEPASRDLWFCAIIADIDEATGQCQRLQRLRWEVDQHPANVL